jgi:hypothetical protein
MGLEPNDKAELFWLFVLNFSLALSCLLGRMFAGLYIQGLAVVALVAWVIVASEQDSPRLRQSARGFLSVARLMVSLFIILMIAASSIYPNGIPWAYGDRYW